MIKDILAADGRHLGFSIVIFVVAVLLLVAGVVAYIATFGANLSGSPSRWGQFGDYIGGVLNPGFSLLALAALLYTIHLQSRELRNSTLEFKNSIRVLTEQSESLKLQNFERTFFEMVRLHHDIIRDMDLESKEGKRVQGRDCFRWLFGNFKEAYKEVAETERTPGHLIDQAYARFGERRRQEVDHYFRNFHAILKFVDESAAQTPERYVDILRAQMSSREINLLFYTALCSYNSELKQLLETHSMFENLDPDAVINKRREVGLFDRRAYGNEYGRIQEAVRRATRERGGCEEDLGSPDTDLN